VGSHDKIAYEDQDARIDFECIFNARYVLIVNFVLFLSVEDNENCRIAHIV
jgi:hypothetical protein